VTTLAATWYDGRSSRPHAVTLRRVDAATIEVDGGDWWRTEALAAITITARLAGTHRTLRFPDGALAQVDDGDEIEAWFCGRHAIEARVDRWERRWLTAAAAVVVAGIAIVLFFAWGLPRLAQAGAHAIPLPVERAIAGQVEIVLRQFGFRDSVLERARTDAIVARYAAYAAQVPGADAYRVTFRGGDIGANAFALPGGEIVATDDLVRLLDDDEVLAVLAHETGHQHHRHVMRSVLQGSAVALAAALMTGDVGSAGAVAIAVPTFLLDQHYSRAFETEADAFAFDSLERVGVSPRRFADAMRKLDAAGGAPRDGEAHGWLSTHPASADRIARALERAETFEQR
jgi:Zn-dependent protease with chaperone function